MFANLIQTNQTLSTALRLGMISNKQAWYLTGNCAAFYSSFPPIQFMFDDKYVFNIDPTDYMIMYGGNCVILVGPTDDQTIFGNSAIIGYSFLAGFYAGFDVEMNKIGFAPINNQKSYVTVVPHSVIDDIVSDIKNIPGWAIALIVIAVIVIIVAIFFLVRRYRLKQLSSNLQDYNDQTALIDDSEHGEKTFDMSGKATLN